MSGGGGLASAAAMLRSTATERDREKGREKERDAKSRATDSGLSEEDRVRPAAVALRQQQRHALNDSVGKELRM